ncbi:hypothetical protein CLAFUW4_08348 [Fulvia fulva]|uniref:Uncharacterized protein n=1 Tax=Passalora fulva TaxID=5499 RepID=A0A9Q8P6D0_PASFU|nr:uncharacterized protein CLAFUR5_08454 [Fulvia fulva]KAK4629544.1 hypothetical protein CLAFUR4_08353 [Fulvia fulva]KAK4629851.1 hypothetical protein CLAFUR0_08348 [Fulvia fulva]UJO14702.1 hypothetical protein CLAFUR5_08454 [Fulvia fulva]WPV12148.1 hypothetical protein CLAFUW4_08348 [Fulvia fulva]WPV27442.1 hypothetical protein CLAFUW7_08348 [Fulvia fulva]
MADVMSAPGGMDPPPPPILPGKQLPASRALDPEEGTSSDSEASQNADSDKYYCGKCKRCKKKSKFTLIRKTKKTQNRTANCKKCRGQSNKVK